MFAPKLSIYTAGRPIQVMSMVLEYMYLIIIENQEECVNILN